jgi:hypothetical protein
MASGGGGRGWGLVRGGGALLWTACSGSDDAVSTQRCQDLDGLFDTLSADVGVFVCIWEFLCGWWCSLGAVCGHVPEGGVLTGGVPGLVPNKAHGRFLVACLGEFVRK